MQNQEFLRYLQHDERFMHEIGESLHFLTFQV